MSNTDKNLGRAMADYFDSDEPEAQGDLEGAKREVDFILRGLAPLPQNAAILDVPCGEGHHAQVLNRDHDFRVTGIDGGAKLIRRAKDKYTGPNFIHAYFDDLNGEGVVKDESQDSVMCINHSFGYLPAVKENEDFLANMYKKLKPGGQLVIQTAFKAIYQSPDLGLALGESRRLGKVIYFHPDDGPFVESVLPRDYALAPEDEHFRNLGITNSALCSPDGVIGPRKKYAGYLTIKDDGDPNPAERKPVDMPVLRSLAHHSGIDDRCINFYAEPYDEDARNVYLCIMTFTKPLTDNTAIKSVTESVNVSVNKT